MDYTFLDFLRLMGALGLFIYGMKVMSEGIQKVAGARMRQILEAMTSSRVKGIFTGFLITGLLQSSSATTVMVVSFVNAGLLSLIESIGVIMGANIGTTVTAWLISIIGFKVKISAAALPIIAIGLPMLFMKSSRMKSWGETLIGFAILFIGLQELKSSVPDLQSNPEILSFLSTYTDLGVLSVLIFVVIGTLLTLVVQSSSAAMALTLVMANNGWIPFELAAAMVLGENIGTTVTANLAAIVGNVYAKRAARAHFVFNVFGVIWMLVVFSAFIGGIDWYMNTSYNQSPLDPSQPEAIPIALSIFHTTFNIINTAALVGFAPFIARTVTRLVPADGDEEFHLEFIGSQIIRTPDLSIVEARKEIAKFGTIVAKMNNQMRLLLGKRKDEKIAKKIDKIHTYEQITDRLEVEIASYLTKVAEGNISEELSEKIRTLLSISNDLERIGDLYYQMALAINRKNESQAWFTDKQQQSLLEMTALIDQALEVMNRNLDAANDSVSPEEAHRVEKEIDSKRNELRRKHLRDIEKRDYDIRSSVIYAELFTTMERVGDHIHNVTKALSGDI